MLPHRKVLLVACLVLGIGSISTTLGLALHVRSSAYRRAIENDLADRLGMAVDIGAVEPRSWHSRTLRDVNVYLERDDLQVFSCASAMWAESAGGSDRYTLDLEDGWLLVGTGQWSESQYERLLAGGFGHNFAELGLTEIRLKGFDLRFAHEMMDLRAGATSGVILFYEDGTAQASLICRRLNDQEMPQPVNIASRFTPGAGLTFHEVRLTVPTIPLGALGLDQLVGSHITTGEFAGTVRYTQTETGETVAVSGSLRDADLAELTASIPGGPFVGRLNIELVDATFARRALVRVDLHGNVAGLRVDQLLPGLAAKTTDAVLDLQIDQMRWREGKLQYLSARGGCTGLSVDALTGLWGEGRVTGTATFVIHSLHVVNDVLRSATVDVIVNPPDGQPGIIDRKTLLWVAKQVWGVDLSWWLPEQLDHIEYTKFGARLELDDGLLRVLGTHGPNGKTVLTVKLAGFEYGILEQPKDPFEVPDLLALLRDRADKVELHEVRGLWGKLGPAP